jgi:hypothetical protein
LYDFIYIDVKIALDCRRLSNHSDIWQFNANRHEGFILAWLPKLQRGSGKLTNERRFVASRDCREFHADNHAKPEMLNSWLNNYEKALAKQMVLWYALGWIV